MPGGGREAWCAFPAAPAEGTSPAGTLVLDLWPPELRESELLFQAPPLWWFVTDPGCGMLVPPGPLRTLLWSLLLIFSLQGSQQPPALTAVAPE